MSIDEQQFVAKHLLRPLHADGGHNAKGDADVSFLSAAGVGATTHCTPAHCTHTAPLFFLPGGPAVIVQMVARMGPNRPTWERQGRRQAQGTASSLPSQPLHFCARPSRYTCIQESTPIWARTRSNTVGSGQPLPSRAHRACSGPVVLGIGIHHVAPSLALPASLPPPPSSYTNSIPHTHPEEDFRFFGASWRAGSGRRRWTGSRLNIVKTKADT